MGGAPVLPSLEIGDHETGIWALSADGHGRTLVTGTEDGSVAAWDLRSRACIWQVSSLSITDEDLGQCTLSVRKTCIVAGQHEGDTAPATLCCYLWRVMPRIWVCPMALGYGLSPL